MTAADNLFANDRAGHSTGERLRRLRDPEFAISVASGMLRRAWDHISLSEFSTIYRRVCGRTMCSNARLRGLYLGVKSVIERGVPGGFVECGCALGGSAGLIALTLQKLGANRQLWLFDTFEGLPAPTHEDPDFDIAMPFTGACTGTLDEVQQLFKSLGVVEGTHFVKGLFQDTLPDCRIDQIAFLHIDGDWYQSVKTCLINLYDKVAPGGIIQFDDYGYWAGARRAVDEFLSTRQIPCRLRKLDYSGRQLTKGD